MDKTAELSESYKHFKTIVVVVSMNSGSSNEYFEIFIISDTISSDKIFINGVSSYAGNNPYVNAAAVQFTNETTIKVIGLYNHMWSAPKIIAVHGIN